MGNKVVIKCPNLTGIAFLRTKFRVHSCFLILEIFSNYYSSYQLSTSSYLITVGNGPNITIVHIKTFENSKVYYLTLCNEIQSLGSAGSLVGDSRSTGHVKKEMFPRIFYIKFAISTSLVS